MFYIDIDRKTETRYAPEKLIGFHPSKDPSDPEGGVYDVLDAFFLGEIKKLPMAGTRVIVDDEARPYNLSYNLYGSTEYWWILMWYNDLITPSQLVAGTTVRYPVLSKLETLYGRLGAKARKVAKKPVVARIPTVSGNIGDPDSMERVIPSGNGDTNAMLLRAYASFAAQKFNLHYAIIDDFETVEGIDMGKSSGLVHAPFRVDLNAGGREAPMLVTKEHSLLDRANCNALHIAMLPDTDSLRMEYSLDGGFRWDSFTDGIIYTEGSETITLRFIYTPSGKDPMKRTFNGYVIVHD